MERNGLSLVIGGLILLLMVSAVVSAQDTFSIYAENDSRYLKPNGKTDRHYTSGMNLVYTTQPEWSWLKDFGDWGRPLDESDKATAAGFFLGQNIYTPNHADKPELRTADERVYAGWLYTGMFVERRRQNTLDHLSLDVGVVGPSAKGKQVQQNIHNLIGSDGCVGWDDQLDDEPAANVSWVQKRRLTGGLLAPTEHTDVIADFGGTAGSVYINGEAGVTLRLGVSLPNDFGPGRLKTPTSAASRDTQSKSSFYLYSRLAGRAVAYDRFLSGLTPRPFVGLGSLGAVWHCGNWELAYAQNFFTEEFKEGDFNDSFGALTLTYLF